MPPSHLVITANAEAFQVNEINTHHHKGTSVTTHETCVMFPMLTNPRVLQPTPIQTTNGPPRQPPTLHTHAPLPWLFSSTLQQTSQKID